MLNNTVKIEFCVIVIILIRTIYTYMLINYILNYFSKGFILFLYKIERKLFFAKEKFKFVYYTSKVHIE